MLLLLLAGCGDDAPAGQATTGSGGSGGSCVVDTSYDPAIDPSKFQDGVDNPLFPLVIGTKLHYTEDEELDVDIEVTDMQKSVLGVNSVVVHDVVSFDGEVLEDTYDWYAQDEDGTVWYMGEDTKELSGGEVVSTEGSWEAGVDGAKPGMIIPGSPAVAMMYRQEYYPCHAEDMGEIVDLDSDVSVVAGDYTGCLKTRDTTPLEPDVLEEKYYCPGVGVVLSVDVESGDREELISIETP